MIAVFSVRSNEKQETPPMHYTSFGTGVYTVQIRIIQVYRIQYIHRNKVLFSDIIEILRWSHFLK